MSEGGCRFKPVYPAYRFSFLLLERLSFRDFPLKEQIDTRRLILVTGGTDPELLLEKGYLVDVVQKDVDLGLNPVKLVQMVSLNPAEPLAPK